MLPPSYSSVILKNSRGLASLPEGTSRRPARGMPWWRWRQSLQVRSELHIAASAATVWEWLVQVQRWPEWYAEAPAIRYARLTRTELRAGSVLTWRSLGLPLTATVEEYVPGQRLSWRVRGPGIRACHRWLLRETVTGCQVIVQQTSVGWRSALGELLRPHSAVGHQQRWLRALSRQALYGGPPYLHASPSKMATQYATYFLNPKLM